MRSSLLVLGLMLNFMSCRCGLDRPFAGLGRGFCLGLTRLEGVAVEDDLCNLHRGKRLAMSGQLLVLLFALVMEYQDFVAAALFHHASTDARAIALGAANLALLGAHRQHVDKINLAMRGRGLLDPDHVAGRHPVLLSTCADHRVHKNPPLHSCRRGLIALRTINDSSPAAPFASFERLPLLPRRTRALD